MTSAVTDIATVVAADLSVSGASGMEIGELHIGGSGSSVVDGPMPKQETGTGDVVQIQSTLAAATDAAEFAAAEVASGTVAGEDKVLLLKGGNSSGSPVVGSRSGSDAGRPTVPQSGRYTIGQRPDLCLTRGERP